MRKVKGLEVKVNKTDKEGTRKSQKVFPGIIIIAFIAAAITFFLLLNIEKSLLSNYEKGVVWASEADIVSGYTNGKFGPDDSITREQLAKVLYRYAEYKGYDVTASESLSSFKDASSVASYAKRYMEWAVAEGLIKGSSGNLNPKGEATRAEIAAILKRFVERYEPAVG